MEDEFNQLLRRLWPLIAQLYRFTEEGVAEARNTFQAKGRNYDPWFFSHSVRWHVIGCLDVLSLSNTNVSYTTINQAMSGIAIDFDGIQLKVFKATQGLLPAPGRSSGKTRFYNDNLFGSDVEVFSPKSLAVLWDLDSDYAVDLQLVCPLGGGDPWKPGHARWAFPIPYPASVEAVEIDSPEPQAQQTPEDIPDFERTDNEAEEDTGTEEE